MFDFLGKTTKTAGPSTPVSVAGLNGMPQAGDQFTVVKSEKEARKIVADLQDLARAGHVVAERKVSLEDFFNRLQEGESKTLNLIVKADVQGSLEPIVNSLKKIGDNNEEVTLEILLSSTGNITEFDVMLASASDAVILGFNVDADPIARNAANSEQVQINTYNIIYKLFEDVEKAMKGMLAPVYTDRVIGRAEVREVFRIRSVGAIAGSYMRTGEARRNAKARVVRDSKLIFDSKVSSLKHLQDNVREVRTGFEFGVSLEGWSDFKPGDIIEFYVTERVENE
jgi:translation initiation factor IF-2